MDLQEHMDAEIKRNKARVKKQVIYALVLLAAVYIIAITTYHATEGWSWENSIYFSTSTMTTVGYGDVVPHTYWGRMFTVALMWVGIGVGFYVIFAIQEYGKTELYNMMQHMEEQMQQRRLARQRKEKPKVFH